MIVFKLKQTYTGVWYIYSPKGFIVGGPFNGNKFRALDWANAYCSSWMNSRVELDESL